MLGARGGGRRGEAIGGLDRVTNASRITIGNRGRAAHAIDLKGHSGK